MYENSMACTAAEILNDFHQKIGFVCKVLKRSCPDARLSDLEKYVLELADNVSGFAQLSESEMIWAIGNLHGNSSNGDVRETMHLAFSYAKDMRACSVSKEKLTVSELLTDCEGGQIFEAWRAADF